MLYVLGILAIIAIFLFVFDVELFFSKGHVYVFYDSSVGRSYIQLF